LSNVSCTRLGSTSSTVKIQVPNRETLTKKNTTMTANFPSDKKLCFGVNIVGPGIESKTKECAPQLGIFKGFVTHEDGNEITLEVSRGSGRKIEMYFYSQDLGLACPDAGGSELDSKLLYAIGRVENVDMSESEVKVEIPISFPGVTQNILATLNLPATCRSSTSNEQPSGNQIRISPRTEQTANGIIIRSSLSATTAVNQVSNDNAVKIKAQIKFNP
jgi:hypothetical protein